MSTIEKWSPAHLWRAWNREWQLAGQWGKKPEMSELADAIALTVDYPNGRRDCWRVMDGQLVPERETLRKMSVWANPFLPWTPDEPWDEYLERAERARLRGDFGLDWMINGFPETRGGTTP